ncbi:MAG TPA: DoxX family protein [Gaiellaceae bacterium]|nr:DoxX family protein [Gaiellaceae bacterium]
MSYGILLLRIGAGGTLFAHGSQKLLGWFGGGGPKGTASFFGSLGFRASALLALLAGLGESSGLAFAFGFLTPFAAVAMTTVMLVAIITVHWKNGFFNGNGGFELPLLIATVAVSVAATGPGRFSVDRAIGWDDNLSGLWWGVGVAAVAAATATFVVTALRERNRGAQI